MAQSQLYRTLTPGAKVYSLASETKQNLCACFSETQTLVLSEQEYDGVVALGKSERVPSESLKRGMELLKQHGL